MKFYLVVYKVEGKLKWTVLRTVSQEIAQKDIVWRDSDLGNRNVKWEMVVCIPVVSIIEGCERV